MMNQIALVEQYVRLRAELLTDHPDIDPVTLTDTLEGATEITETVAKYIREAISDETLAEALAARIKDMTERKGRLQDRAARRRAIALALMRAIGMQKIEEPDFTGSLRHVPPHVIVTDETALPDTYVKTVRSPDKMKLKDALGRGEIISGATLSNGSETITIRTR